MTSKLPAKCRACAFVTTPDCTCQRCSTVRATAFCSDLCYQDFRAELDLDKRRLA